jgi:hypothetical protein
MASLNAETSVNAGRLDSAPYAGTDGSSGETRFLQPAAGRILTGAGLAGEHLQQVLRHHSSVARRIVIGKQILKIVGKGSPPVL